MILFGAEVEATFFAGLEDGVNLVRSASAEIRNDQPTMPLHGYPIVATVVALVPLNETASTTTRLAVAEVTHSALTFDMASRYPMALARISRFAKLERGWNGPNTVPPTPLASTIAVHIVRDFAEAAMALAVNADPQVAPLEDGGYQFEWHYRDHELFVACDPNGVLSILESAPGHEREYTGDRTTLQTALRWFFANP